MKLLSKLGEIIKKNKAITGVLVVLLLVIAFNNRDSNPEYLSYEVVTTDVIDEVELTGSVSAVDRADLSFKSGGEVVSVSVEAGEKVAKGQVLARLNTGTLSGELDRSNGAAAAARASIASANAALDQALANLSSVRAGNSGSLSTIESARSNLTEVTNEQNQLVKSAESALLSTDLQAYPNDASRNVAQPTVTGSYTSSQEGSYVLNFYRSGANSGYSARFTGLENGTVSFPDNGLPVRLGSRGLFVAVPEDTTGYSTTDFTISIPNTRSSSYQSLLSKLETAKSTRERLITSAQAELDRLLAQETGNNSATTAEERRALAGVDSARAGVAAANASLSQANAGVKIAQSQLEDKVLRSPFAGTIARSDLQVGESVTSNQVVATIVSEGDFEIELQVPEIDVARLEEGMTATITLDAYGAAKKWQGEIIAIESIETVVEGVPVYITTVKILDPTSEIKIGMNARASIELDRFENVIAVPQSYILEDDGRNYVLVRSESSNDVIEKTVELGLRGADSLVQIVSGLEVGEIIVREETSNE